tara:strand:+ start:1053 stop:2036 length:984 start_codon:yes stop_codon:yes gene_type:complete
MALIDAFNTSALSETQKRDLNLLPTEASVTKRGIQGDVLIEPKPNPIKRKGSKLIQGTNNADITIGTDQPGEIGSGYGSQTGAGAIDLVAGRMSSDIRTQIENKRGLKSTPLYVDNNLSLDASRITIAQKTDVDANFALADGMSGDTKAKAAIALKSDSIRIMSRDGGVKILTRTDKTNSLGSKSISIPRIEMIAGNQDRNIQASTKSSKNNVVVRDVLNRLDELNSSLDSFITSQIEFNNQVASHTHSSPMLMSVGTAAGGGPGMINGGKVLPSGGLMSGGSKVYGMEMISKFDSIINKLKVSILQLNGTEVFGEKQSGSKSTFTT